MVSDVPGILLDFFFLFFFFVFGTLTDVGLKRYSLINVVEIRGISAFAMGARHVVAKSTPEYRDSCGVSFLLVFPSRHVVNKSVASTEYVMKRFLAPTD